MDDIRVPTKQPSNASELRDSTYTEVLKITYEGRIFWKGREVESDEDFRTAMLAVRDALCGQKT